MYMTHEEAGLIMGSENQKERMEDRIWENITQLKGGNMDEKEDGIRIIGNPDAAVDDPVGTPG